MKKITIAIITLSLITSIIITNKESLVHAGYDRQGLITRIMQLIKERQGESLLSAVENNDLQKVKSLIASGTDLEYKRTYNQWNRWECMNTFNIREGEKKATQISIVNRADFVCRAIGCSFFCNWCQ